MTQTVFVTGGAGYVGSHCCKAFSEAGWSVVVYDNLSRGWRDFVRWGPLIEGDILDYEALSSAMAQVKPDIVAHFAAVAYVGESVADPGRYYLTNTSGSLNVLRAMQQAGVESILFSSSCTTYGVPKATPISEDHPQAPISPYGWSKLVVEQMLRDFGAAHGLRSVALRYFNASGADPGGEIGERHEPEPHLIPLAIRAAMPGDFELSIFGGDFETPDGTCIRDYVHVSDLSDAHLKAISYLQAGGASDVFNLATGAGASVIEITKAVERVGGHPVRYKMGPRRQGDPAALVASADKAARILGWRPSRSSLDQIVADAWKWHAQDNASGRDLELIQIQNTSEMP